MRKKKISIISFWILTNFLFLINWNFFIKIFFIRDFSIIADDEVSGKPPLLLIITAAPLLEASKLVLPNGSSHLEQTIEILVF